MGLMDGATIVEILRPFVELSPERLAQTSTYLDLLLKWNAKVNLTAVRQAEAVVARHFGESFFAAEKLALRWARAQAFPACLSPCQRLLFK
jgi:16S rRNA (guanine527-N7)-methyltransferase